MSLAESFARSGFAQLISSSAGRIARILIGLGLIGCGYTGRAGSSGVVLMVAGLIPLAAGAFNLCFISALLGGPIRGAAIPNSKPKS